MIDHKKWLACLMVLPLLLGVFFASVFYQAGKIDNFNQNARESVSQQSSVTHATYNQSSYESPLDGYLISEMKEGLATLYRPVPLSTEMPSELLLKNLALARNASSTVFYVSNSAVKPILTPTYTNHESTTSPSDLLRVKVGESFVGNSGCMGFRTRAQYRLDRVYSEDGEWRIQLTKRHESRSQLKELPERSQDESMIVNEVSPTDVSPVILKEQPFSIGDSQSNGALIIGAEMLIPVYVSKDEVIFYIQRYAC